jgi:hypothetical protein
LVDVTFTTRAGCRAGQGLDVAHHAGDDRSPRGRAADRSGPGDTAAGKILDADQGHDSPRGPVVELVRPSTLLAMPATIEADHPK